VLDRRSDGGNGFRLVGSTPHPAADGPGAQDRPAVHGPVPRAAKIALQIAGAILEIAG